MNITKSNNLAAERSPHAVLDLPSRANKALKIERLLGLEPTATPLRLLEIGTGSGGIAHYFANHSALRCEVTAVDVVDQRLIKEGFDFRLVESIALPFADESFDVVITNHVMRLCGRGKHYDYEPLSLGELDALLKASSLTFRHIEVEAFREMLAIEATNGLAIRIAALLPDTMLSRLRPIIPTLICLLRKKGEKHGEG